jgi:hypothetical protein
MLKPCDLAGEVRNFRTRWRRPRDPAGVGPTWWRVMVKERFEQDSNSPHKVQTI